MNIKPKHKFIVEENIGKAPNKEIYPIYIQCADNAVFDNVSKVLNKEKYKEILLFINIAISSSKLQIYISINKCYDIQDVIQWLNGILKDV